MALKIAALIVLLLATHTLAREVTTSTMAQEVTLTVPFYNVYGALYPAIEASVVGVTDNATTLFFPGPVGGESDMFGYTSGPVTLITGPSTYSLAYDMPVLTYSGIQECITYSTNVQCAQTDYRHDHCSSVDTRAGCRDQSSTFMVPDERYQYETSQVALVAVTAGAEKLTEGGSASTNAARVSESTAQTGEGITSLPSATQAEPTLTSTVHNAPTSSEESTTTSASGTAIQQSDTITVPVYPGYDAADRDFFPALASIIAVNSDVTTLSIFCTYCQSSVDWTLIVGPRTYSKNIAQPDLSFTSTKKCTPMTASSIVCDGTISDGWGTDTFTTHWRSTFPPESIASAMLILTTGTEKLDESTSTTTITQASTTIALPAYNTASTTITRVVSVIGVKSSVTTFSAFCEGCPPPYNWTIIAGPHTYSERFAQPDLGIKSTQRCIPTNSPSMRCVGHSSDAYLPFFSVGITTYSPESVRTALLLVTGGMEKLIESHAVATATASANDTAKGAAVVKTPSRKAGLVAAAAYGLGLLWD